LTLTWR